MLQCLVGHYRPEVGTPDADVDDVANALAGVTLPRATPDAVGEVSHLVEHGVDSRDHVLTINDDGSAFRGAQSDVQDGPVFRDVDLLTPEHGVDARAQAGFLRQLQEELEGFVGDAVLRVIQVEARRLGRHVLAALGVIGKELSEMERADIFLMGFKGLPCFTFSERRDLCCHVCAPSSIAGILESWNDGIMEELEAVPTFHHSIIPIFQQSSRRYSTIP
jgi:hypothetical protein